MGSRSHGPAAIPQALGMLLPAVLDELPDTSVMVFDTDLRFLLTRGRALAGNQLDPGALEGRLASQALPAERWTWYEPLYRGALLGESAALDVSSPDGTRQYIVRVAPLRAADGTIVGGVSVATDVTQTHRALHSAAEAEQQARLLADEAARSEQITRTAMEFAPAGMAVVDLDRRFRQVNPALCGLLARDEDWLLQRGVADVLDDAGNALDLRMRAELLGTHRRSITAEKVLCRGDGGIVWVDHAIALLRDDQDRPTGYVSQYMDITAAHAAREQLHYQATHDPLTRLTNRAELLATLHRVLGRTPRTDVGTAVLFVDLDGLKAVNDTLGHAAGDAVLVEVAERISARVRADDVVARLGGDEYVVLLPAVHTIADAVRIAEGVRAAIQRPVLVTDRTVRVTASIGAALAAPGETPELLLERADRAVYRAKRDGRDRIAVYDPDLDG
jgi:diguanylate cyclase (GGDEF)-like protein/PAS domain S-box-containing protein